MLERGSHKCGNVMCCKFDQLSCRLQGSKVVAQPQINRKATGEESGTAPPLRPSPHRPPGVTQKEGKIYTMKRYATLAMVTQPDKVLGWLCGLCRPTEKNR